MIVLYGNTAAHITQCGCKELLPPAGLCAELLCLHESGTSNLKQHAEF